MYTLRQSIKQIARRNPFFIKANYFNTHFKRMNFFNIYQRNLTFYTPIQANFSTTTEKTIYEELGGEKAIDAVVDSFYVKILADPLVNSFFKDIDMNRQRKKQKNFIAFATGGPNKYEGRDMRKAHLRFKLEDKHFDKIVELLVATLKEFKISDELIGKVGAKLLPLRNEVLNR